MKKTGYVLLLAVVFVFLLCGCQARTSAIGTWNASVKVLDTNDIRAEDAFSTAEYVSVLTLNRDMTGSRKDTTTFKMKDGLSSTEQGYAQVIQSAYENYAKKNSKDSFRWSGDGARIYIDGTLWGEMASANSIVGKGIDPANPTYNKELYSITYKK